MSKISVTVDYGVGAFTVSPSGRDVAMASRSGLYIMDLQEPFSPPRWLSLRTLWEVADVQWCPHPNHPSWVLSTSNQKLILWDLALPSQNAIENVLHGHSRAITDINFNPSKPDVVASCSIDTYIHLWDLRDPLRPSMSFADFDAGAAQVKWCKNKPHMLASAHDNRLLLWDDRKNNIPVVNIAAHTGRINGIDFDRNQSNRILTCSTDRTVKLWNYGDLESQTPVLTMNTSYPIWRSRFLPAGSGALLVPLRGGKDSAFLVDLNGHPENSTVDVEPIRTFEEHTAPIKDVSIRREDNGFDMLTWSSDNTLKVWTIDSDSLNKVHVPSSLSPLLRRDITYHASPLEKDAHSNRRGFFKLQQTSDEGYSHLDWIAGVRLGNEENLATPQFSRDGVNDEAADSTAAPVESLSKEVTAVGAKFPKIQFESIDLYTGRATLTLRGPWGVGEELLVLRVNLKFPSEYPYAAMSCQVEEDPNVDAATLAEMEDFLKTSNQELALHGKPALEFSLRYLMGDKIPIESVLTEEKNNNVDHFGDSHGLYESDDDYGFINDSSDEDSVISNHEVEQDEEADAGQYLDEFASIPKIDSTPLPKNCGAVWTRDGRLLCFFNKTNPDAENKELPALDRIFAGDQSESDSDVYVSDDSDFDAPGDKQWDMAAARLTMKFGVDSEQVSHRDTVEETNSLSSTKLGRAKFEIVDFNDILPNRVDIAREYWLDQKHSPQEMAAHNARVAEKYGRHDDAYIWRIMEYYVQLDHYDPSIDVIQPPLRPNTNTFFEWTGHPFSWSTSAAIISHLEKTQNVQLLAGIACVLSKSFRPVVARAQKQYQEGSEMLPYIPYKESKYSVSLDKAEVSFIDGESFQNLREVNHRLSVPHLAYNLELGSYGGPVSLGTSPSNAFRRSQSVISTPATPGEFAPMSYSSDIDLLLERRDSSQTVSLASSPSGFPQQYASAPRRESIQVSDSMEITVTLMNPVNYDREFLDADYGLSQPMLDLAQQLLHVMNHHRNMYAVLLQDWGLDLQRLEVLKFNYFGNYVGGSIKLRDVSRDESVVGLNYSDYDDETHNVSRRLWQAEKMSCQYCKEPIRRKAFVCVNCSHMLHDDCATEWWKNSDECASGCACKCPEYL